MFVIKPVDDIFSKLISSNVADDSATEYSAATTYVTGNICKVSATGTVYKCLADSILIDGVSVAVKGFYPPDYLVSNEATYPWMELRAINYKAMFDNFINTQTQSDAGVDYIEVLLNAGNCDAVALFNVVASDVTITVYDNQSNVLSTETKETYEQVTTLEEYFFTEVVYKRKVIFTFGIGIGGSIKIKIRNAGSTAKCGMVVLGKKEYLGMTKDEVELPITDYSTYKTDTLGRTKLEVGSYADLCNFTLYFMEDYSGKSFDVVRDFLISLRGKAAVWCVDNTDKTWETNQSLMICGYFTDLTPTRRNDLSSGDIKLAGVV